MAVRSAGEGRERNFQRSGDFPKQVDRWSTASEFDLAKHRPADAGDLCEPLERVSAAGSQQPQIVADDGRQVLFIGQRGG